MNSSPSDWLPDSFFRSPAWRIFRADYRREHGLLPDPRIDDGWVEIARKLLSASDACDRSGAATEARFAFAVWQAGRTLQWLLEAQLLTPRPFEEIAALCSLTEPVVEAYHHLFFDVRSRPEATDWVMARAVRSGPLNNFAGPQPAGLWKFAAFTGGPLVLDVVVAVTLNRPLPGWLRETFVTHPVLEEQRIRLKAKLAIAALTVGSAHQLGSLLELSAQLRGLEVAAGLSVGEESPLLPAAGEFLSALGRLATTEPKSVARATASGPLTPERPRRLDPVHTVTPERGD